MTERFEFEIINQEYVISEYDRDNYSLNDEQSARALTKRLNELVRTCNKLIKENEKLKIKNNVYLQNKRFDFICDDENCYFKQDDKKINCYEVVDVLNKFNKENEELEEYGEYYRKLAIRFDNDNENLISDNAFLKKENEELKKQVHLIHMASMFSTVKSFKGDVSKRYKYSDETDTIYDTANHYGQYSKVLDKKEITMLLNEYETIIKELSE